MTQHHPDTQWLTEYVAGTLSDAHALCVSTHLTYCAKCAREVNQLQTVGAAVFDQQPPCEAVKPGTFDRVLERIGSAPVDAPAEVTPADTGGTYPAVINKLVPGGFDKLRWTKLGKRIRVAQLQRLDEQRELALHKLLPGGAVASHDHHGQEITVVLCGSFSDEDGVYSNGDFLLRQPGQTHRPTVKGNKECICLSVTDAPVKFTGLLTRLLNPLVAYQHKH